MVLSEKKGNFLSDINISLATIKKVLIALCIIMAILYGTYSIAYSIKFLFNALAACFFAKQTEILFVTHQSSRTRQDAKELVKTSMPEISGLILALTLPVSTPLYVTVIGTLFAVFVVRMAFGGFSFNIFNVAIAARLFIQVSWESALSSVQPIGLFDYLLSLVFDYDYAKSSELLYGTSNISLVLCGVLIVALLYLSFMKVLNPLITFTVITLYAISFYAVGGTGMFLTPILLIVAIFALNDPITTASTMMGKLMAITIYISVMIYMVFGKMNVNGIMFAILFMNMMVPLIDDRVNEKSSKYKVMIIAVIILVVSIYLTNISISEVIVNG